MDDSVGPRLGDAFGELMLAQARDLGSPTYELVERDDGFLAVNDARSYFRQLPEWTPLERQACEQAHGRILDVGCGVGRHSLAMIDRGLDVTGLEPSAGAAEVARRRGVPVLEQRLDQISEGAYDTIVLLGHNLSLLAGPESAADTLTRLADCAAPGAVLLGHTMDPYRTEDRLHLEYHQRNRARGRPGGQLRIRVRYLDLATDWFDYWFLTVDELSEIVKATPWTLTAVSHSGPDYLARLTF